MVNLGAKVSVDRVGFIGCLRDENSRTVDCGGMTDTIIGMQDRGVVLIKTVCWCELL